MPHGPSVRSPPLCPLATLGSSQTPWTIQRSPLLLRVPSSAQTYLAIPFSTKDARTYGALYGLRDVYTIMSILARPRTSEIPPVSSYSRLCFRNGTIPESILDQYGHHTQSMYTPLYTMWPRGHLYAPLGIYMCIPWYILSQIPSQRVSGMVSKPSKYLKYGYFGHFGHVEMVQIMESMDFMVLGCLGHLDMDTIWGAQMVSRTSSSSSCGTSVPPYSPVCPFGIPYMCTPYGYTMYRYHTIYGILEALQRPPNRVQMTLY